MSLLMERFELPRDIGFNVGKIADPRAPAKERQAASWLYLCGEELASMDGGMSNAQVQGAVSGSARVRESMAALRRGEG